jgi:hypothetical protein
MQGVLDRYELIIPDSSTITLAGHIPRLSTIRESEEFNRARLVDVNNKLYFALREHLSVSRYADESGNNFSVTIYSPRNQHPNELTRFAEWLQRKLNHLGELAFSEMHGDE